MYPCEQVWRSRVDERARRRIGPGIVELAPNREVGERWALAEQVGALGEVRLKDRKGLEEGVLDLRASLGIRTDERNAINHPLANHRHPTGQLYVVRNRHHRACDTPRGRELINLARPAIVEHPLVAPFIAELFEQYRQELCHRIGRVNRGLRM